MIVLAARRPRAAAVTAMVLSAALVRALLAPLGEGRSTLVFAVCLAAIAFVNRDLGRVGERRWGAVRSGLLGVAVGVLLLAPVLGHGWAGRPLPQFWTWGAVAAAIASLEEAVLRGPLQRAWTEERGLSAALVASAVVFAAIHVPRYGLDALPLDFAAGLAFAGLRALTGRITPCVLAHAIADWGAWFWA